MKPFDSELILKYDCKPKSSAVLPSAVQLTLPSLQSIMEFNVSGYLLRTAFSSQFTGVLCGFSLPLSI